ncbi:MAG: carboxypeptidase M32 [Coriobacteriales bacterium]|nr:carboxypeptidase M32 [Coriobacteriales bacterium]
MQAAGLNVPAEDEAKAEDAFVADKSDEPERTPETPVAEPEVTPTLEEDLAELRRVERHLFAHRYAAAELETFGETIDPAQATADRAETLAILLEEDHALLSDPKVGSTLERLQERSGELKPLVATQVRVLARDRHQLVSVPADLQARLVRLSSEAYDAWRQAKANNDWRSYAPYLDKLVMLKRRIAQLQNPDADPYDTMLDEHEIGTNRAFYNSFFANVKRGIIPLLSSISMSGRTLSRACIEGRFDEARQWELARDIAELEGIDEDAHFLTSTEHPFSEAMSSHYAVTAAHVDYEDLMSNVYTMLHEVGHNLYEQGVNPKFNRTSLKGGTSMGMHEAQSRFFENYVGRDRAFIGPLLSLMKKRFPGQLSRVTPNQLYLAVNRVVPSLIRTEADELTYPLHIIIRYEIEQLLIAGKATAREVPKLWAERYRSYIGIDVPNDTLGALQDVHWSNGSFGYFPTYALGNAYAAQLRAKMISEGMDWRGLLAAGDLAPIRAWLRERVWRFGRSKDPAEIIQDACGEPFNPSYYAEYLSDKYSAIYHLH